MEIDKIQAQIFALQKFQIAVRVIAWFLVAWIGIEVFIHIDNHGLKHLLELLWYGPNPTDAKP